MLPWNALSNSNVFSGAIDKTALWLERVGGLENAKRRMVEIATKSPGRYFVFCDFPHTVVAQIGGALTHRAGKEVSCFHVG